MRKLSSILKKGQIIFKNLVNSIHSQICLFDIKYQVFANKEIQYFIDLSYILLC